MYTLPSIQGRSLFNDNKCMIYKTVNFNFQKITSVTADNILFGVVSFEMIAIEI